MEYFSGGQLCLRHGCAPEERLLLMFQSYFDESEDGGTIVVSGWAASAKEWLVFEGEWSEYLTRNGIDAFHMNEFGKNGKHYHAWGDNPKRYCDFLLEGAAIIKRHVNFGISRGIFLKEYNEADRQCEIKSKIGPAFSVCGLLVACRAQKRGVSGGFKAE
ncbi:MAG TPA: hypothetical protein VL128_19230, partial [Candidatus Eisenbacteria bacterium]|nr:hypothetical protein [Candidatus Eisenbacteria bacterium]